MLADRGVIMPAGRRAVALTLRIRLPECGGAEHCIVGARKLYQCNACHRQTSLTAGTLFNSTKVSLTTSRASPRLNWAAGSA